MFKILFFVALIAAAICAIITFYYNGRHNEMVEKAGENQLAMEHLKLTPEYESVETRSENAKSAARFFGLAAVILLVVMAVTAFTGNIDKKAADTDATAPVEESYADGEEDTADDYANVPDDIIFYNDKVQDKGNGKNFNFGPNAYKTAKRGYDARDELLRRCEKDPVLLAAVDSWLDVNLGTRLCGVFFEDNAEWRQAIADYIDAMVYDPELFHNSYEATYSLIMEESTPTVEKIKSSSVEDQMYMLPKQYTRDGKIPDLIVCATDHSKGHYLTLKFKIKGDTFKVRFRMECGFQPTNCAEKLNTTAEKSVSVGTGGSKKSVSPGKSKNPNPGTGGNNPTNPTKPSGGDGCKDTQTFEPSGGQQSERTTTDPTGGGNGTDNRNDPPSGGATKVDQGSGGGNRNPDPPKSDPVVDSGNGKVSDDD